MSNDVLTLTATVDTRQYTSGAETIGKANKQIESSTASAANKMNQSTGQAGNSVENVAGKSEKSTGRIAAAFGAVAGVAQSVVTKAFNMVTDSIGGAVSRVDTLNNFPKVMSSLGYSATDAGNQVQRMSDRLQGLPTSLDQMTGMVQKIAPLTGSLGEATDISLAFNDALLAGGKSTAMQSDAMEQYSQMLSVGKVDMMAWRSVVNAMPGQMDQLSKSILGDKANQMDLYNAMKSGKVSFQQFNDAVVNLDKQGSGHFKSFHDQAFAATGGIKTGWANMQNAINRGLADIIQNIGASNISSTIAGIGTSFENVAKAIAPIIGNIIRFVQSMAGLPAVQGTVAALAGAFIALGTAMKITSTIQGITKAFAAFKEAQQATTLAQAAFNAVMSINPFTVIIVAIGAMVGALAYFFTQTETGRKIWGEFTDWLKSTWDSVSKFFSTLWDGITKVFSNAADAVKNAWNGVGDWFKNIWKGLSDGATNAWNGVVKAVSDAFNKVEDVIKNGANAIAEFPSWLGDQIINGITGLFDRIMGVLQGWYDNSDGFIHTALGGVITYVQTVWDVLSGIVQAGIDLIHTIVQVVMDIINGDWQGAWNAISSFFQGVWDGIVQFFSPIIQSIQDLISNALTTIQNVWTTIWSAIRDFVSDIWNTISGAVSNAINTVSGVISNIMGAIQNTWNNIWSAIKNFVSNIWDGISGAVSNGIHRAADVIGNVLNGIQNTWNNTWNAVSRFVSGIWDGIVNAVSNGISRVAGVVGRIRDTVLGAVSGAGQWLYDTGRQIINGLGNGIVSGFNWLRNRISEMGSNIVGWAKSVLKVGSPSKVMGDEIGQWLPAGVAVGFDKGMPDLQRDVTAKLDGLVRTTQMSDIVKNPMPFTPNVPMTSGYTVPTSQSNYTTRSTVNAPITVQTNDPMAAGMEAARIINFHYV